MYVGLRDILRDFIVYSRFKFLRKFKFCVSYLVKWYPGEIKAESFYPQGLHGVNAGSPQILLQLLCKLNRLKC